MIMIVTDQAACVGYPGGRVIEIATPRGLHLQEGYYDMTDQVGRGIKLLHYGAYKYRGGGYNCDRPDHKYRGNNDDTHL